MSVKLKLVEAEEQAKTWKRVSSNLVLHVPSGVYYVRKFKAGKGELHRSTGEKRKGRAQSIADDMLADWLGNKITGKRSVTVSEFLTVLQDQLETEVLHKRRDLVTRDKDRDFLFGRGKGKGVIDRYFGHVHLQMIDEDFWANWVRKGDWMADRTTLFDVAKYLSLVLTRAHRAKLITRKPKIENPDQAKPDTREKIVSQSEIEAIVAEASKPERLWQLVQLHLGYECGNRPGEQRKLRWSQITFDRSGGTVRAVIRWDIDKAGRKRGKGREFEASPRTSELLWELRQKSVSKSEYVFPMVTDPFKPQTKVYQNRAWKRLLWDAGIRRPIWLNWLRHTFYTTALLDAREEVQLVSEYGGTSIKTLQKRYLHADAVRTRSVSVAVRIKKPGDDQK